MADIELVIKLPKELYESYKGRPPMLGDVGMDMIAQSIANGTPLPEHHGRLIDADALHHKMGEWLKLSQKADESVMVTLDDIAISTMMEIEEAPTIIEADRGE